MFGPINKALTKRIYLGCQVKFIEKVNLMLKAFLSVFVRQTEE